MIMINVILEREKVELDGLSVFSSLKVDIPSSFFPNKILLAEFGTF